MKCIICGRESSKPICEVCSRAIAMDFPFILHRGMALSDESRDLDDENTPHIILFQRDLQRLNELAKRALNGEDVNFLLLARYAVLFHEKFSFFLNNFELGDNYYLTLAKNFASKIDDDDGKFLLAKIHVYMGEIEEAEEIMSKMWKKDRKFAMFYGDILVKGGKWGRAIEIYNELLANSPNDEELWMKMADVICVSGNYDEAERAYLRVLQYDQNNALAWYKRGKCLINAGKWGGALQSFQTATRKDPLLKDAYEEMLKILMDRGMYSRALETLKKMKEAGFDVDDRIAEVEEAMQS